MRLFNLFRKSEWSKLKAYPTAVQQDIALLTAFDSLIKTAVSNAVKLSITAERGEALKPWVRLCDALGEQLFINELLLSMLTTGVGKEFSNIKWTYLAPQKAVTVLGILAMCEIRNAEQLIVENDLKYSGFSSDPDDARSQYLVMLAGAADVEDLDDVKAFDDIFFREFWCSLRKTIFQDIQINVNSESSGLTAVTKERFEKLSKPRQEILLMFADSFSKKVLSKESIPETPKPVAKPFDLEQSKLDHPFLFVPFPKLVNLMDKLSPQIFHFIVSLSVDEYDIRRMVQAKDVVPINFLYDMLKFDAAILSYGIIGAVIARQESRFVGSGIWKKFTEVFEKRHLPDRVSAAQVLLAGLLGDANPNMKIDASSLTSLGLNLLMEIRRAPSNYNKVGENGNANIAPLLGGTIILKHLFNHPRYGKLIGSYVVEVIADIGLDLEELTHGELLAWDQQKDLQV
ncbi:MAG: hypothetical protein Q7U70_05285 [Methylotenera sp.]|nr:hypothetical protein [Methylotenera sp.]MDO9389140.1 hypothetical protein [Methylotenera sp.]